MSSLPRLAASVAEAEARLAALIAACPAGGIAVVPAAGRGSRSGLAMPKQYFSVGAQTVLGRSIRTLAESPSIAAVLVILDPEDQHWDAHGLERELRDLEQVVAVRQGGATRRDSVYAGLCLLSAALNGRERTPNPWVLVHDAARPGLSQNALHRLWQQLQQQASDPWSGAILSVPLVDTIKRSNGAEQSPGVGSTVPREGLWAAQTPQAFRLAALMAAYEQAPAATDEAFAMELLGHGSKIKLVMGESKNFKLTQPEDFLIMEALMAGQESGSRNLGPPIAVGQGFDVHALVAGRPLIIGGVEIPYEKGLLGHSDADVLLHAITDAILGAAGLGDIGRHFPDTDPAFQGADSSRLLKTVIARVHEQGWRVAQVDATVIAQAPKISPYAAQMQTVIAQCCEVAPGQVNVKGKTTEHLGFTGRGEGIAAQAVALLVRHSA